MVRRRPARTGLDVPAWVATFEPAAWPLGVTEWREAVRTYCRRQDLLHSDVELWLRVVSETHAIRLGVIREDRVRVTVTQLEA